jgi:hypothetical protein
VLNISIRLLNFVDQCLHAVVMHTLTRCIAWLLGTLAAIETKFDRVFTKKNNLDLGTGCLCCLDRSLDRLIGNTIVPI